MKRKKGMPYSYEFPKVADLTASFALFCFEGDSAYVLLGKRSSKAKAFPGAWCIPGGFLNVGERFKDCAIRELREETGIEVNEPFDRFGLEYPGIIYVGVFDDPERDPRGRVIDNVYTATVSTRQTPDLTHPECDLEDAQWVPVEKLPDMQLAFDHNLIVREAYLKVLHGK